MRRAGRAPWLALAGLALALGGAVGFSGCGSSGGSSDEPGAGPPPVEPPPGETPPPDAEPPGARPCDALAVAAGTRDVTLERVAEGLADPIGIAWIPEDTRRLFVVEQAGTVRVVTDEFLLPAPFLDIRERVTAGGERGLLGLAFPPGHPESDPRFYVHYSDERGDTRLSRFRVTGDDPNRADPESEEILLELEQPFGNHNGGQLAFGPDGLLYMGLGDGGAGGDPNGNGQNLGTLLGTILRLDVSPPRGFSVPPSNPFVGVPGARPEIWAYGLRNPWRFSFDRATGDLYIGDVGQNSREEISVGLASRGGGENFGWNVTEGFSCFRPQSGCDTTGLTPPVVDYGHDRGCSVTGGYVYRGRRLPALAGTYLYGDFCSGMVLGFELEGGRAVREIDLSDATRAAGLERISAFGEDACGELYVTDYADGELYRLAPR